MWELSWWVGHFIQGFGILVGILVGTAINLRVEQYRQKSNEQQMIANFIFELNFNIKKIDTWMEEISNYRNAVTYDELEQYYGYFDLTNVISVTANQLFVTGNLYKYLDHGDIGELQVIFAEFSPNGADQISKQIAQNKANYVAALTPERAALKEDYKTVALGDVDYWERKFKKHRKTLSDILRKMGN